MYLKNINKTECYTFFFQKYNTIYIFLNYIRAYLNVFSYFPSFLSILFKLRPSYKVLYLLSMLSNEYVRKYQTITLLEKLIVEK